MPEKTYSTQVIPEGSSLEPAAEWLRQGEVVAFPTETVYGLGSNGLDPAAVQAIYAAKERPADNPLILHIYPGFDLERIAKKVPDTARKLMEAFWPGPLTMSFEKQPWVPDITTAGLSTVGVRMPSHPVAMQLLRMTDLPIAAPSANRSGRPSPTTAAHVFEDMQGRIPCIVDGGSCQVGLESTFLDMTGEIPMILRPGAISKEMLEAVCGPIAVEPSVAKGLAIADSEHPRSPGMKYRHYAPKASMVLLRGTLDAKAAWIAGHLSETGGKTGLLISAELLEALQARGIPASDDVYIENLGTRTDPGEMSRRLFAALRRFDEENCLSIFGEAFADTGVEMALMNRLRRAAAGRILDV